MGKRLGLVTAGLLALATLVPATTAVAASIDLTETSFDFGNQTVATMASHSFTLTNNTGLPIVLVSRSDTNSANFPPTNDTCDTLTPLADGESCGFDVEFTPESAGTKSGMISYDYGTAGIASVQLDGVGIAAEVTPTPTPLVTPTPTPLVTPTPTPEVTPTPTPEGSPTPTPEGSPTPTPTGVLCNITVVKSGDGEVPLPDAEFTLYADDGDFAFDAGVDTQVGAPVVTDENGEATFADLPCSDFFLVETVAPQGYDFAEPVLVQLNAEENADAAVPVEDSLSVGGTPTPTPSEIPAGEGTGASPTPTHAPAPPTSFEDGAGTSLPGAALLALAFVFMLSGLGLVIVPIRRRAGR